MSFSEVTSNLALEGTDSNDDKLPINPLTLFSFTVGRGVEATMHKIEHKKEFVKKGLSLLTDSTTQCPLCEQEIITDKLLQIIQDYQEIFDETFSQEEKNVKDSIRQYKSILNKLCDIQAPPANQIALDELNVFETAKMAMPPLGISDEQKAFINQEIDLVIQKESNVLEKPEGSRAAEISALVTDITQKIGAYNEAAKQINSQITQLKLDSDEGKLDGRKSLLEHEVKRLSLEILFFSEQICIGCIF